MILGLFRMTGKIQHRQPAITELTSCGNFLSQKNISVHVGLFHSKRRYSLGDQNTQQIYSEFGIQK